MDRADFKLAVVGLGYVGLPLAVEFSRKRPVLGYDTNLERVRALRNGKDSTMEVSPSDLERAVNLSYTSDIHDLANCNVFFMPRFIK